MSTDSFGANEKFSSEWFDEAFESMNVPPNVRKFSEALCRAANIKGICDPGYIANLAVAHLSNPGGSAVSVQPLIDRLRGSYGKSDLPSDDEIEAMFRKTIGQ